MQDLSAVTLAKPEVMSAPYDTYDLLRCEAPVFFDATLNVYLVTSYQLIQEVLTHHAVFSNVPDPSVMPLYGKEQDIAELYEKEGGWLTVPVLISTDPPEHTELRGIVQRAITIGIVKRMNPAIRTVANELVDAFGDRSTVEFMTAFARRLPLYVIADLLGVPRVHENMLDIPEIVRSVSRRTRGKSAVLPDSVALRGRQRGERPSTAFIGAAIPGRRQ
jgi:cytochrome P450